MRSLGDSNRLLPCSRVPASDGASSLVSLREPPRQVACNRWELVLDCGTCPPPPNILAVARPAFSEPSLQLAS